ncbi:hypothetical protein [Methylobacterium sp. ID0610]|uniref:hypothetical protein n=1 Tax=Methylobacterium carpenticola TaxID=3344827 RepID=UPI00367B3A8C
MRTGLLMAAFACLLAGRAAEAGDLRAEATPQPAGEAAPAVPPRLRTASAEDGPIPTTTGTTLPLAKPAKPWCADGRVVGSGRGFCQIN